MQISDARFYWWAIDSLAYDCSSIESMNNYNLLPYLGKIRPDLNCPLVVDYVSLMKLSQFNTIDPKYIFSVPLEVLPAPIDSHGISKKQIDTTFGSLIVTRNIQDGSDAATFKFTPTTTVLKCQDSLKLYPTTTINESTRTLADFKNFPHITNKTNLFVARVPDELHLSNARIIDWLNSAGSVWTAGNQSLKKLADLGVVVAGTVDSLGEQSLQHPLIQKLFGTTWLKLSFNQDLAVQSQNSGMPTFAWYHLTKTSTSVINLDEFTHFFWMSASSFSNAQKEFPKILSGYHSSGLGSTAEFISNAIPNRHFQPFYSISTWREDILSK